jgi:hypothetical protein
MDILPTGNQKLHMQWFTLMFCVSEELGSISDRRLAIVTLVSMTILSFSRKMLEQNLKIGCGHLHLYPSVRIVTGSNLSPGSAADQSLVARILNVCSLWNFPYFEL